MEEFPKKSCGISTYDEWNFKPQISSIFHFDRVSDGRMRHVLGVKLESARDVDTKKLPKLK